MRHKTSHAALKSVAGATQAEVRPFRIFTKPLIDDIPQLACLSKERRFEMRVVSSVLPFRVNTYVVDHLIDWTRVPDDPMFQLVFPQPGMLSDEHFDRIASLLRDGAADDALRRAVQDVRAELNPHPAEQRTLNVATLDDEVLPGLQHKFRETVLFFPTAGQTCHSYCSFCFRWAQFVGDPDLRIAASEADNLHEYLRRHREVSDLLVTGGDPMVMRTPHLERYLSGFTAPEFEHLQTIRIGTKALTYWPFRFVNDPDADDVLRLFERLVDAGKHVAVMAHMNHWREMEGPGFEEAVKRIQNTGAVIRTQAPLLANVNDDSSVWSTMWRRQVRLGIVPYYMYIVRDTGARRYYEVPLARALEIFQGAIRSVSGLGQTVRGPAMSAGPGKVEVVGVAPGSDDDEDVFVLRFIQAHKPRWKHRTFFARFDTEATWLDDLRPAFGAPRFFFEDEYEEMRELHAGSDRALSI